MNKSAMSLNMKYVKLIPVLGICLIVSLFLPYISLKEYGASFNGIKVFMDAVGLLSTGGGSGRLNFLAAAMGIPVALAVITSLLPLFLPQKSTIILSITSFIIGMLCAIGILFTAVSVINELNLLPVSFLVKYFGTGYWITLLLNLLGIIISMKAAKINPGYIVLFVMSSIWLFPILWVLLISFRGESGSYTSYFWPKDLTFKNYIVLLTDTSQFHYVKWFGNTLFVAVCSCVISTFIVLSTAFTLSALRFKGRKAFMNLLLILGMFPGFMSMIAVYYILKGLGLTQSLIALILVYSGGSALGYYVAKGFFDTIPKSLYEAAYIDGATKWYVFTRITMPLSKPIIIYTILVSFMVPWADFIFARVIMGDNYSNYTLALGLFTMLERANIETWYTRFAAGAVLVSIPIAILFISLQKYYVEGLSGSVKG